MFDALEQTWQNTDQSNVINELYEGKMKDCVQCLQVLKLSLYSILSDILCCALHVSCSKMDEFIYLK